MLLNPDKSEVLLVARKSNAEKFAGGAGVCVAGSQIVYSVQLKASVSCWIETCLSISMSETS